MRAYALGDVVALEQLVERYSSSAVRFAQHFIREHHAAEDLSQDVFVKLVTVLRDGGYDPARGRFAPFFFRMIRNLAIDRLRGRAGHAALEMEIAATREADAAFIVERDERRGIVRRMIGELPHSERAAITLREFEGLSYKEIAESLGAPVDSVKTWIFRARRKMEDAWLAMEAKRDSV